MKVTQHPFTGISARPRSASTFSQLHWVNAFARRRRLAKVPAPLDVADAVAEVSATLACLSAPARGRADGADAIPHVLHIDHDRAASLALGCLLKPEARVTNVATLAEARVILRKQLFSLVVLDPDLADGNGAGLTTLLAGSPLLVYAAERPAWRAPVSSLSCFLPKTSTTSRQLWTTISMMLGLAQQESAGD